MIRISGILFQTLRSLLAKLRMCPRLRPVTVLAFLVIVVTFALLPLGKKALFDATNQRQRNGVNFCDPSEKSGESVNN